MLEPNQRDEFAPMPFCIKALTPEGAATRYLVYSTDKDFVPVTANNADEAVKQSGIAAPVRIIREEVMGRLILERSMFE